MMHQQAILDILPDHVDGLRDFSVDCPAHSITVLNLE